MIRIDREGEGYRATVIDSPAGETVERFALSVDGPEIIAFVQLLGRAGDSRAPVSRALRLSMEVQPGEAAGSAGAVDSSAPGTDGDPPEIIAMRFGTVLFDALIGRGVRELLRASRSLADARSMGLRVRLRFVGVPELSGLPWEYLYDPEERRYLDLTADTALVRYLELKQAIEPLEVELPLRVLVVIADTPPALDVEAEWRRLETALADVVRSRKVAVERLAPATLRSLRERLREGDVHVLHFVGHGDFEAGPGGGGLVFEAEGGGADRVSGDQLAVMLADHDSLRLVVLNACEGARGCLDGPQAGVAQQLLAHGVPAVLAMQFPISDQAAIEFASTFYDAVAKDHPVEAAVGEARKAIYADDHGLEWGTPVLFSRSPDGHLWRTKRKRPNPLRYVLGAGVAIAAAAALILGLVRPRQMDGDFNIAVANFSELGNDAGGTAAADAERLSLRVYEILSLEIGQLDEELGARIWHDSMGFMEKGVTIGTVDGSDPAEREANAKALAQRIGANVVVHGALTAEESGRAIFAPEFYVGELQGQADELIGPHSLGVPIPLILPLSIPSNAIRANRLVAPRAGLLTHFTAGLVYEMSGDPERALQIFTAAEAALGPPGQGDGREVLHLFIGREHQHLARLTADADERLRHMESSREHFEKARQARPSYARAHIGLGNYFYDRAFQLSPGERIGSGELEDALDHFLIAASPAAPELIQLKARMGIGNTHRLWFEAAQAKDDTASASAHFDQAVHQFERALDLAGTAHPEQSGHTQLMLGATHEARARALTRAGDAARAGDHLEHARDAYSRCIETADGAPGSWFLEGLRDGSCEPYLERVCEAAAALGVPCG